MTETEETATVADGKKDTDKNMLGKETDNATNIVQKEDTKHHSNGVTEEASASLSKGNAELKADEGGTADAKSAKREDADSKAAELEAANEKKTDKNTGDKKAEIMAKGDTKNATSDAKRSEAVEKPGSGDIRKGDTTENADPEIAEVAVTKTTKTWAKSAGEAIERDLGAAAKAHFEFALPLVTKSPNLERLEKATERLVKALQAAPEEKSTTRGYGELALLYGRALLGFVVRGAADGDIFAGKAKAGDEEDVESDENEGENEEKDDTTEELCWTQLEVARVAFEKSAARDRLCEATRTIGEFMLACDEASAAGEEFGRAAGMCEGRVLAECLYKRYLSLRRVEPDGAKKSLRDAIEVMSGIDGTEDVVKEMRGELMALGGDEGRGVKRSAEVTVTRVTPKRKK